MPRLAVAKVEGKGRGVFALEPIAKGEVVVTDNVLLAPTKSFVQTGVLAHYPFCWDSPDNACIALGLTSLANHDGENPNCLTERDFGRLLLRLIAKRDIEAGEEITYDYKVPLWFEPKPPTRLNMEKTNVTSS